MGYPYRVQIAFDVISQVLSEAQANPARWLRERDFQAEIGSRLNQVYKFIGCGTIFGNYNWHVLEKNGLSAKQRWDRVSYEPLVKYRYQPDGKEYSAYPDVVVWGDKERSSADAWPKWAIDFALELKVDSGSSSDWDVVKLAHLLEQGAIEYACVIRVQRTATANAGGEVTWLNRENVKLIEASAGAGGAWTQFYEKFLTNQDLSLGRQFWFVDVRLPFGLSEAELQLSR